MEKEKMGKEEEKENMKKEDTIKLGGTEFIVHREARWFLKPSAITSGGDFKESEDGKMRFPKIRATILEKVIEFFYWSLEYRRWVSYRCGPMVMANVQRNLDSRNVI